MDLYSAYLQIPIRKGDYPYTAYKASSELYLFLLLQCYKEYNNFLESYGTDY